METLVGILGGSLATILIGRIVDLFQQSREQRYTLQRSYFERKLASAEAMAIKWNTLASAIGIYATVWKEMATEDSEASGTRVLNMFQAQAQKSIEVMQQSLADASQAYLIYFDTDVDEYFGRDMLERLIPVFARIEKHFFLYQQWVQAMNEAETMEEGKIYMGKADGVWEEMRPNIDEAALLVEEMRGRVMRGIIALREELRPYDQSRGLGFLVHKWMRDFRDQEGTDEQMDSRLRVSQHTQA